MGLTFKSAHQADLKGKGILYEDDDEPVKLVDRDDSFVIKEFERITANDLGNGKFLFNFTNMEDLNYVMAKGPFHFNFCYRIVHIDTMELTEGRMLIDEDSRRPLKFSRKVEYEGYCPSIGTRQPTVERSDVFTRMHLPARQNVIRDTQGNDQSFISLR
ncbi:hypothetical protein IGI04_025755 [Brassica rapa subsp. trilocularis]|uniref:DUF4283 domain-containing protein n=1 Tax=Brassica rapa subsp. trilocularis TaxID=1813537 RepID=A0ABQ7KUD4_BRACM|nr:hypothetical protein IGI04_025755 [Brassica rapa subsp. trilocularis]